MTALLWPFQNHRYPRYTTDSYRTQLGTLAVDSRTDPTISADIVSRLISTREGEKPLNIDTIQQLENIYRHQMTRQDLVQSTQDLSNFLNSEELLKNIGPHIIAQELQHRWIQKKDTSYITKNWIIDERNIIPYTKFFFLPYTIDNLYHKNFRNYKLFDIGVDGSIEPRIFLVALDKKYNEIRYYCYDPDLKNYTNKVDKLLRDNFLFSLSA